MSESPPRVSHSRIGSSVQDSFTLEVVGNDDWNGLHIPEFLQVAYARGLPPPVITAMRPWQRELFSKVEWQRGQNAVVLVPTAGGKTMAADVAIAQALDGSAASKAILALPFVALASEKEEEYRLRFFSHQVRGYYQNKGGPDFHRGRIAICTYEKAHMIVNSALDSGYEDQIKVIVIDEAHMIGDDHRGPAIEALIIKFLLMKHRPRIVLLTATINRADAARLAQWINGFAYISDRRPSPVTQYLIDATSGQLSKMNNGSLIPFLSMRKVKGDSSYLLDPLRSLLKTSPTALSIVFENTRKETINTAQFISRHLFKEIDGLPSIAPPADEVIEKRKALVERLKQASEETRDKVLAHCILKGVAYHHAGLTLEERRLIEDGARDGTIIVLVATTTLSAGINIQSVRRVIVDGVYRHFSEGKSAIPATQFIQMIGRAGRSAPGEAFIVMKSSYDSERSLIFKLASQRIEDLTTHLTDPGEFGRYFLQFLTTGLIDAVNGIEELLPLCYKFFVNKSSIAECITEVRANIMTEKLFDPETRTITALGRAIANSTLSIEEGEIMSQILAQAQQLLCLSDPVHLISIFVSPNMISKVNRQPQDSLIWGTIMELHLHVMILVTGKTEDYILAIQQRAAKLGHGGWGFDEQFDRDMDRIFIASMIDELIREVPINDIVDRYRVDKGTLESIQMQTGSSATQTIRFCETMGATALAAAINSIRIRINHAAKDDLLQLLKLPSCTRKFARNLVNHGVKTVAQVARMKSYALLPRISSNKEPNAKEKAIAVKLVKEAMAIVGAEQVLEEIDIQESEEPEPEEQPQKTSLIDDSDFPSSLEFET